MVCISFPVRGVDGVPEGWHGDLLVDVGDTLRYMGLLATVAHICARLQVTGRTT